MVILTEINDLQKRHTKRFADVENRARTMMAGPVRQDLSTEVIKEHSGSPSGPGRIDALVAADRPFARRHGFPLWPTPPVGIISGGLLASLQFPFIGGGSMYSAAAKSVGTSYAQFLYSPDGTKNMLPRGLIEAINIFALARMKRAGRDLLAYQRSLL